MAGKVLFIGIAGASASGKTSIAKTLAERFGGSVPIISQDWYYRALDDKSLGPTHNWDIPSSFNRELILESIKSWKSGKPVWTPRHDYAAYEQIDNVELVRPSPVMIFEGILAFEDPEIAKLLDLKIYVDCDPDVALGRRVLRDTNERGYKLELVLERYRTHVKPAFETYILPMKKLADVIIPNNGSDGVYNMNSIDIIESYIQNKLNKAMNRINMINQ